MRNIYNTKKEWRGGFLPFFVLVPFWFFFGGGPCLLGTKTTTFTENTSRTPCHIIVLKRTEPHCRHFPITKKEDDVAWCERASCHSSEL